MLRTVNELDQFVVESADGRIGQVVDFYFDDAFWAVRFLVVRTDDWLAGRKVLISPLAIGRPDASAKTLPAAVTREQVRMSPDIDTHKPVSRQHEVENYGYYGYPFYWGGSGMWGNSTLPALMLAAQRGDESAGLTRKQQEFVEAQAAFHRQRGDDPHLRSCRAISGYHLQASDGEIGHVEGFVVDDESWAIRYLIVNTSDWWLGHQVLIAPPWIADINWIDATVSVELTRQAVKDAPRYDGKTLPDRVQERGLHEHYGRAVYWGDD
jgi:hypothetical protein